MNKSLIILGIVVLLICVGLSGCSEIMGVDIDESIKGQWYARQGEQNTLYAFTFYDDGTCKYTVSFLYLMGKYYTVGDKLECHLDDSPRTIQNYYDIEMPDKDTLILTTTRDDGLAHDGRLEFTRLN